MASKMDPQKRKFLKHLGLLGFGALIGLGISKVTSPSETEIINNWSNKEIASGEKRVWYDDEERMNNLEPGDHDVQVSGKPVIMVNVCAYHIDDNGDGEYEDAEEKKYCTMPCRDVCPIKFDESGKEKKAIEKHRVQAEGTYRGKIIPDVNLDKCIGCTNCFRICGYNAIEWVNYRN